MKKIIIITVICLSCFLYAVRLWLQSSSVSLKITNNSSEEIKETKVTLCDDEGVLNNIQPGGSQVISLRVKKDCVYKAAVIFASGNTIEKDQLGYAAPLLTYSDTLLVDSKSIILDRQIIKK